MLLNLFSRIGNYSCGSTRDLVLRVLVSHIPPLLHLLPVKDQGVGRQNGGSVIQIQFHLPVERFQAPDVHVEPLNVDLHEIEKMGDQVEGIP